MGKWVWGGVVGGWAGCPGVGRGARSVDVAGLGGWVGVGCVPVRGQLGWVLDVLDDYPSPLPPGGGVAHV